MRNHFKKSLSISLAAFGLVAAGAFSANDAQAVPSFARQTGMPCDACHFQGFPSLNAMGRGFRAEGYTMEGSQASIEGENALKLPASLNLSLVTKIRHQSSNGEAAEATDYGQLQWPDEAALLIGGRASANAGFLTEVALFGVAGEADLTDGAVEASSFLSFKVAFLAAKAGDVQLSVIPFQTDALGVAYGFELLNTGAQRSQRPMEERKAMSAAQYLGFDGAATGIALVAAAPNWFVNYSMWGPGAGHLDVKLTGLAGYLRGAYMFDLAGLDTAVGIQMMTGTAKLDSGDHKTDAKVALAGQVIDAQTQGEVAGMPLGIYFSTGSVPKAGDDATTTYYNQGGAAKSATAVAAKLGVGEGWQVYFATNSAKNSSELSDVRNTLGTTYHIAQNIKLEVYQSGFSGDVVGTGDKTSMTTLSLFSGF